MITKFEELAALCDQGVRFAICTIPGGLADNIFLLNKYHNRAIETNRKLVINTKYLGCPISGFLEIPIGYHWATNLGSIARRGRMAVCNLMVRCEDWDLKIWDSDSPIVVNDAFSCRGPDRNSEILGVFGIQEWAKEFILRRIPADSYEAIHVRHTDYRTDYLSYFSKIPAETRIVVCTDSQEVYEEAVLRFSNIIRTDRSRSKDGKPLHLKSRGMSKTEIGEMLTDLFLLANASRIHHPCLLPDPKISSDNLNSGNWISGFVRLAMDLKEKGMHKKLLEENPS